MRASPLSSFFFFNDTATTEIYTLSPHDALPISTSGRARMVAAAAGAIHAADASFPGRGRDRVCTRTRYRDGATRANRSEEHTSELQSPDHLVCRLLLEKKKKSNIEATKRHHATS